jgi:hypothetical protein
VQQTTKLIRSYHPQFPDCEYYLPLFSKARRNASKHPDICIETCKSLLEGIAKTIILGLDKDSSLDDLEKKDVEPLVKTAAKLLRANDDVIEDNFVNRVSGLAHALGALRNARGDISHGKAAPKLLASDDHLARLCLQMTDAVTYYLLRSYYSAKQRQQHTEAAEVDEAEELLPDGLPYIKYDANPAFNDDLDSRYPLDGKMLYSEALYRLYYEQYVLELEAYDDALVAEGEANGDTE